jgi:HAD superfamily hydrolase (TIGR01490 family)
MASTSSAENRSTKSYYAFFDLDHTLTDTISGRELALAAFRKGLMSFPDLADAIRLSLGYRMKFLIPDKAVARMAQWVKGISVATMEKLCNEVTEMKLIPAIYNEVKYELQLHRDNNAGLVILSSSIEPVCRRIAQIMEMDDAICTEMETRDGILTGRPAGNFCFGEEKAVRLREYCKKNNSKLQDAWYYGDAISDLHALSIVGHPVCINPEKKLRKIAMQNDWKIYYWNK